MPNVNPVIDEVRRKARYGRQDWVVWRDKQGELRHGRATAENIKAAMLAMGTQGNFRLYARNTGNPHKMTWRLGMTLLANAKAGLL